MSIIFAGAWLTTMNERREVLEGASVCMEKDRIAALGTSQDLRRRFPEAEMVDGKRRIVMPGMVNTHTHLFQTLLKGLGDDMVLKKCLCGNYNSWPQFVRGHLTLRNILWLRRTRTEYSHPFFSPSHEFQDRKQKPTKAARKKGTANRAFF
jgi:hypothetical protein